MRRKNDILWKGMLEEVFDDMLRFVFPKVDKELDMQKGFVFLDKELTEMYPEPEKASDTRFVDKLVKVFTQDGAERWMLVHVEVQGWDDPQFPKRMFTYYYRILDRYDRPVTAIAIFSGMDGKKMPDKFEDHCLGTHAIYQYNALCITDYSDEVLAANENPFALVVLAAKKALLRGKDLDKQLLKQKLMVVRLLQEKGLFGKHKIGAILTFLNNYLLFEKPETNRIFMDEVNRITGKKNTMGIFEQLAEIRAEEMAEKKDHLFVENLLRDSDFSLEKIATLANVSLDYVQKVKAELRLTEPR